MRTFLHHGNTLTDTYMRHEIQEPVSDPVTFIDHGGRRILVASAFAKPIFAPREDVLDEFFDRAELGYRAVVDEGAVPTHLIDAEMIRRALAALGVGEVIVPPAFPVAVADHLRSRGVEVVADPVAWEARKRSKTPWELEGIERAQRAAEAGMIVAARMLKESEPTPDGRLRFEGEVLTAEYMREAVGETLTQLGGDADAVNVQSGDACLEPLSRGTGPIAADTTCIVDLYPRDRRTGTFTEMSRTFVPGTPSAEVVALHEACSKALAIAVDALRPGASDVYEKVATFFHDEGYPTQLHDGGGGAIGEGFVAAIGHGIGLDQHEPPWMGGRSDELVEGDVVAIQPSLCFEGTGGVRLGDVLLVTDGAPERFTTPLPYDLEP